MDFTWDLTPTPIGTAVAVASDAGFVSFHVTEDDPQWALERVVRELGAPVRHRAGLLADVAADLERYFEGEPVDFDLPLDWRLMSGFSRDALEVVATIPRGQVATYGEVAALAGRPRAARAVGSACRRTPFSLVVPVHRVVRADGTVGEFGSSPETKRFLLELEGVHLAP